MQNNKILKINLDICIYCDRILEIIIKDVTMIKIYAKTIRNGKIKNSLKYVNDEDFEIDHFENYIKDICEKFDSPTPIILAKHIRDYILFGISTFVVDDFIEKVFFDKLVIESYAE